MASTFSLSLHYPLSRSKNYQQAIKLSGKFERFTKGKSNVVEVGLKELFEKWEYFNLLFWRTVDWKGMTLEWNHMKFHSHQDKTRIFYALQHAHVSYICFLEDQIRNVWKVPFGLIKYDEIEMSNYSEDDINNLIEMFRIAEIESEIKSDETFREIKVKNQPWFLENNR